jgi:hypothetical protein
MQLRLLKRKLEFDQCRKDHGELILIVDDEENIREIRRPL